MCAIVRTSVDLLDDRESVDTHGVKWYGPVTRKRTHRRRVGPGYLSSEGNVLN